MMLPYNDINLFTRWAQWFHSFYANQTVAFCTHTKIISHSFLYFWVRPES